MRLHTFIYKFIFSRNDNRSRFGKYQEVFFKDGVITGMEKAIKK